MGGSKALVRDIKLNSVDGRIIKFNRIHSDSSLIVSAQKLSNEDVFNKAEKEIEKAGNLSIDDILKGL